MFIDEKDIFLGPALLTYYDVIRLAHYWHVTRPGTKINEILAIDIQRGTCEMAISKLIFPSARLHLTDMNGVPPYVEKFSARDAIIEYSYCDLMVVCYPNAEAVKDKEYTDILRKFKGKYIMSIVDDSCNIEHELDEWGSCDFKIKLDVAVWDTYLLVHRNH